MASNEKHIDLIMRLVDQVSKPLTEIRSHMQQTANTSQRLGRTVQNVGKSITGIGDALLPVSTAIVGMAAAGGHAFLDFDATITAAGAKAGATAEEMQKMRDTAAQLGADMPISASDAATAMDRLAAAGYTASQVMGAMPAIVTASVASGEDLATTSDVVSNALNIWALRSGDVAANAAHVADVVQVAANQSSLGMQDFGIAMQYAGAPAATLGVSIEELSVAMAIMKNNGIEASTIGTSLRSTFTRLSAPPKAAAEAIEMLGIETKNAAGNFLGLQPVIDQLRDKMDGMSNTQQVAIAKAIAGEEAYSGLLSLIRTAPQDYQAMADAITNADGASQKQYEVMEKTMKVTLDNMVGSFESLAISMGTVLTPQITALANGFGSIADLLNELDPSTKMLIGDIAGGIVAFTLFTLVLGHTITFAGSAIRLYGQMGKALQTTAASCRTTTVVTRALNNAFVAMRAGMIRGLIGITNLSSGFRAAAAASRAFIFSPMGIALMAIAAAVYVLYSRWDEFAPYFMSAWGQISDAVSIAFSTIWAALQRIGAAFLPIIQVIRQFFSETGLGGQVVRGIIAVFGVLISLVGGALVGALVTAAGLISNTVVTAVRLASAVINAFLGVLSGIITFITGVFSGDWAQAWQGIVDVFGSIFGGIGEMASAILDGVRGTINAVIDGINSINVSVPDWVPGYGGQQFSLDIPHLYTGVENWIGGPAVVHDRGAEIIDLPSGSRVIPHDQSMAQAYTAGQRSGGVGDIHINIGTANITGSQDVQKLARQIAEQFLYEIRVRAVNANEGAI